MPVQMFRNRSLRQGRQRRWLPGDTMRRANASFSGASPASAAAGAAASTGAAAGSAAGAAAASAPASYGAPTMPTPTPDVMSELPTQVQIDGNIQQGIPTEPSTTFPSPTLGDVQLANQGLLPPVGGGRMPMFSIGNAANGSINLGSILGPRANPNFNPNNPGSGLPYQQGGFFRRLFGDNGGELNQQYVNNYNANVLAQRQQNAGQDFQLLRDQIREQGLAAREMYNASQQAARDRFQMSSNQQKAQNERDEKEYQLTGEYDPILRAQALKRRAQIEAARREIEGSGMIGRWNEQTGTMDVYSREGGTPASTTLGPNGNIISTPAVPSRMVKMDFGGGEATPTGPQPGRIDPAVLQMYNQLSGGAAAAPTPPPAAPLTPPAVALPQGIAPKTLNDVINRARRNAAVSGW